VFGGASACVSVRIEWSIEVQLSVRISGGGGVVFVGVGVLGYRLGKRGGYRWSWGWG